MKEFCFTVHICEQNESDDSIVKFITPDKITKEMLEKEIQETISRYSYIEDGYDDIEKMVDDMLDTIAENLHGLWSYCDIVKPVMISFE